MRTSTYTFDNHTQKDGSTYVYEKHVIDGVVYTNLYLSSPETDKEALLEKRGLEIEESIATQVIERADKEAFESKLETILSAEVQKETFSKEELERYGYALSDTNIVK